MYQRGIIHIFMIIIGLVIVAILIGVFTSGGWVSEETTETTTIVTPSQSQ
ncbi:MAG: hypothetical protein V4665_00735 [Patescibacteria group bacterium]